MRTFYYVRLIDADGGLLASEEIWAPEGMTDPKAVNFMPENVAKDAAAFFDNDENGYSPDGCTVQLFGPFVIGEPAHVFAVAEAEGTDADDFWTVTPAGAPGVTLEDVLRDWPGNTNSDDETIEWTVECQQALLPRVANGEDIDYEAIGLKNAQILELGDAVELGDDEAEHERYLLRQEVLNLCKGLG